VWRSHTTGGLCEIAILKEDSVKKPYYKRIVWRSHITAKMCGGFILQEDCVKEPYYSRAL
jgi:hypothetical protein